MATMMQARNGLYGLEYREEDGRRVAREDRKAYNIKGLWQRHHEIVRLASEGFKNVEIAEILNIDPQTVSNTINSIIGEEKLSEMRQIRDGDTKKRLEQIRIMTQKALGVYQEVLDNETGEASLKDRKEVATTILMELSGLRVPTRIQAQTSHINMTAAELSEFKARGVAAAREAGLLAEPEAVPNESQSDGCEG